MVLSLFPLLCKHSNLTLTLHQKDHSYLNEGWLFIGRFKVGNLAKKNWQFCAL